MHLHYYGDPLSAAEPYARRCSVCGEPQVYRAPTGAGKVFTDVLVEKDDLRTLIEAWRVAGTWLNLDIWELCDRLELILD